MFPGLRGRGTSRARRRTVGAKGRVACALAVAFATTAMPSFAQTTSVVEVPDGPRIHRVATGAEQLHVNAYLIEGETGVIAVDSLLSVDGGRRLRAEADALGKPLGGVVLTHAHPDHYGGLTDLTAGLEVPIFATEGVDDVARRDDAEKGELLGSLGIAWTDRRTFPSRIVEDGETIEVGGVRLRARSVGPTESHHDTLWYLEGPAVPHVFVGDLLTVGEHVYTADAHTGRWIETIEALEASLPDEAVLLLGHGEPATASDLGSVAEYLREYRAAVAEIVGTGVRLTDVEKAALARRMTEFVGGNERNAFFAPQGADPVAQELAAERRP